MRIRTIATGLLVLSLAGRSSPARSETAPLHLADVLAEAHERNPEIRAARERAAAAAAVPGRVRPLDDPTFSYELWNAPDFRVDRADNNILRLSQKVPFPGKRGLAGEVAGRDAEAARAGLASVALDVTAAATRAYYELWAAHELHHVYGRERGLVERFAHVAARKYGVGAVPQSDVLRAQVELTRLVNRVSTQTLALDAARAELNAVLSRELDEPLGVPEPPAPPRLGGDVAGLVALALATRPELAEQGAMVAREDAALRLARRGYYPDFELSVARFQNPRQRNGFGAMAVVSIPLAYRSKYDAGVVEAGARLAAAEAGRRRMQDIVRREVRQAFVRAEAARLQQSLFVTTHIPQAEQSLRVAESAYETSAIDLLGLLDTARTLEAVHVEHIEAEAEFEKARADLQRAVGRELPDDGRRPSTPESSR